MKITKIQDPKTATEVVTGFLGGLNAFQDETVIKDSELTEAKNIILNVDGIEPRPGSLNYGATSGTRLLGAIGYYKSDGTNEFIRFATGANNKLQKYVTGTPTDIGTKTYNASARMNFVQARDKLYMFNGVDALSYYNGSTITTYTALTTPVGLAITVTGSAGTTPYSYRISAFNAVGETLACAAVAITNGNATLDGTNYNKLDWTATAGAVGYNIYGRKATGLGETYLATVYTNTYNDNESDGSGNLIQPSLSLLVPEANTTAGVVGSMAVFAISRIFVAGDPAAPSRLYFGGTADQTGNFAPTSIGGGAIDVFKNDGAIIRAILPFQGGVIIWKDNAIYKFSFNASGLQQLEEITRSFGGISFRSCKHVENDVIFAARKDGRLAFYSLGNQENYTASVLRTNELSIKIQDKLADVNMEYLQHSAGFYFNNIYGCAIPKTSSTVNDRIWCLDTRFGAWTYWEGIKANFFVVYTTSTGTQKLYAGSEDTGYMLEMFRDIRLDNTTAIEGVFATKAFNQKLFNKYKKYWNPVFQFKDVNTSGAIDGEIYHDGIILNASFTVNQQSQGGAGFGQYLFGQPLFGDVGAGTEAQGLSSDVIVEVDSLNIARSVKYVFRFNSTSDVRFKFLSLANTYRVLENKPFPSSYKVYPS